MIQVVLNEVMMNKPYPESGKEFGLVIEKAIAENDVVQVDMSGVQSIPTMFMTTSFGSVMNKHGVERLKKTLVFKHISKVQIEKIGKYLKDFAELYNIHQ